MKRPIALIALILGSCAGPQPGAVQQGPTQELAGRSPGPPERCALINGLDALRVSDNDSHTLLYGNGRTILVNHLGECGLRSEDILVTEPVGSYYCRGDLVRSFDRYSRIPGPACVLGDFVPYSR